MNVSEFEKTARNIYPKASLCDSLISCIAFEKEGVLFRFPQGIAVEEAVDVATDKCAYFRTKEATVLINECSADDLRCRIITRVCVFGFLFYIGREMEPRQLIRFMKNHQLEIIDELYSYQYLLWRSALRADRRKIFSAELELSIEIVHEITYYWNEESPEQKIAMN